MNCALRKTAQVGAMVELLVQFMDPEGIIVDLSAATQLQIILRYENGSFQTFEAEFFTDGTDGIISYVTTINDLMYVGTYFIEGVAVIAGENVKTRNNEIDNALYVYGNADAE